MSQDRRKSAVWGPTTQWSLVCRAADAEREEERNTAWRAIIERYAGPVRVAVRRRLYGRQDADEISADFFAYLFEKSILPKAHPSRGRFRCFMQGVIRNYVRQALRARRGAGSADIDELDPGIDDAPSPLEAEEERDWALGILANATEVLLEQSRRDGELLLRSYGIAPFEVAPLDELCAQSGLNRNAVYQAIHRAKKRLRTAIEDEIRFLVEDETVHREEFALMTERLLQAYPALVVPDGDSDGSVSD